MPEPPPPAWRSRGGEEEGGVWTCVLGRSWPPTELASVTGPRRQNAVNYPVPAQATVSQQEREPTGGEIVDG